MEQMLRIFCFWKFYETIMDEKEVEKKRKMLEWQGEAWRIVKLSVKLKIKKKKERIKKKWWSEIDIWN